MMVVVGGTLFHYVLKQWKNFKRDASISVIVSVNNSLVCWGIETYGNDFQKEKYLKLLATGENWCFLPI